jgi:hypothetical protein
MRYGSLVVGLAKHARESGNAILYPNPATNKINIKFKDLNHALRNQVSVFNLTGELILSEEIECLDSKMQLAIEHLQPGVYFINLKSGEDCYYFKILKL